MLFINREINKLLKDYPCRDYLHNALTFIADGKPEAAYDEICCAILRSGGSLTEEESRIRDQL